MLFTDPALIASSLDRPGLQSQLQSIRASFPTPEDINDHEETAPSKRLRKLFPDYNKPFYGELIAEQIGIERIRGECAHFAAWLTRLERWETPSIAT